MRKFLIGIILTAAMCSAGSAQAKKTSARIPAKPAASPVTTPAVPAGSVSGHTYTNRGLGFEITFPDIWLIAGSDFIAYMKSKGVDITPKPPKASNPASQKKIDADFRRLKILLTVYRSLPERQKMLSHALPPRASAGSTQTGRSRTPSTMLTSCVRR